MAKTGLAAKLGEYLDYLIAKPGDDFPTYLKKGPKEFYLWPFVDAKLSVDHKFRSLTDDSPDLLIAEHDWDVLCRYDEDHHNLDEPNGRRLRVNEWLTFLNDGVPARQAVLGAPGSGKSLLLDMTAVELAEIGKDLLRRSARNIHRIPLPLVLDLPSLAQLASSELICQGIGSVIKAKLLQQFPQECVANYLIEQAATPRTFLLLDGLDEVNKKEHLRGLQTVLRAVLSWNCSLVITSRPYGQKQFRLPKRLHVCQLAECDAGTFIRGWFPDPNDAPRVHRLLQVIGNASCRIPPLLLTLFCQHSADFDLNQPMTEGRLLSRILRSIIAQMRDGLPQLDLLAIEDRLQLAAEIAFECLNSGNDPSDIPPKLIQDVITPGRDYLPSSENDADAVSALKESGILTFSDDADHRYEFTHRLFADFLAAVALATRIEGRGGATARGDDRAKQLDYYLAFVSAKAWSFSWWETILFLAGQLTDPTPLLQRLAEGPDDREFCRVALPGRCLREIDTAGLAATNPVCFETVCQIRDNVLSICDSLMSSNLGIPFPLRRALPVVAIHFPEETTPVILSILSSDAATCRATLLEAIAETAPGTFAKEVFDKVFGIFPKVSSSEAIDCESILIRNSAHIADLEQKLVGLMAAEDLETRYHAYVIWEFFFEQEPDERALPPGELLVCRERRESSITEMFRTIRETGGVIVEDLPLGEGGEPGRWTWHAWGGFYDKGIRYLWDETVEEYVPYADAELIVPPPLSDASDGSLRSAYSWRSGCFGLLIEDNHKIVRREGYEDEKADLTRSLLYWKVFLALEKGRGGVVLDETLKEIWSSEHGDLPEKGLSDCVRFLNKKLGKLHIAVKAVYAVGRRLVDLDAPEAKERKKSSS